MSLSEYFEQHEEQAFVAKALATAVAIILFKNFLSGLIPFLLLIFPVVFLFLVRMHAAATGVDTMELLREHVTFFPMMRSEGERRTEVKPWVTYGIIFANVVIFYGFEMNVPPGLITDNLVFLPHDPDFLNVPLSAFTAIFLHASGGHLWGNMTFLWVVGTAVERRVGWRTFSWLYLVTGLIGGFVYVLVEFIFNGRAGHILGASGAIAGIMGIFAVRCYFKSMIFPLPILGIFSLILPISLKIRLNSLVIMALFFLSDMSGGIGQITGESGSTIGHWAHLGGMISGMLIAGYLKLGEDAVEERHLEIGIRASEAACGYEGGERSLQFALDRSPDNIDALLGMARLKTKFSNVPEGRELYEKALRLMVTQRPAEVAEVFGEYSGKYRAVPPEPVLVSRLAEALRKAGEIELCIHCLERLVEMPAAPRQVREKALFQLATLLEFSSCFEAARSCFARFAAEYPASILAEKAREKAGDEVYAPAPAAPKEEAPPAQFCPACGARMATRTSKEGPNRGKLFWVCGAYPACRTYLPAAEPAEAAEHPAPTAPPLPERYRLVFDGSIALTADPEETRENVARLFRCGRDRVDRLFSGKGAVLKSGLDHATAVRLREAFNRTGAICAMEAEEVPAGEARPCAAQPSPQAAPQVPPVQQQEAFACPKCGHSQEKGESCVRCGVIFAKLATLVERDFHSFHDHLPGGAARPVMSEAHERRWAMACHLMALSGVLVPFGNLLGPLAIWLWKRKESEFVDCHGRTALNYQLTLLLFIVGATVVAAVTCFTMLFLGPAVAILGIYTLFVVAASAIKAHRGDHAEIALSAEFIK
ncbi:MAG TPA: rhomboid family intramembrane serine protease [Geobacteraceae bacterium]